MALVAGDATVTDGMSKAIYDKLVSTFGESPTDGLDDQRKLFCAAVAQAVVEYIKENADVVITPAHSGLQTSAMSGSPTTGPAAPVTAAGAID